MNIWSEMMTALRGGMDELGESMKLSQAIEILSQQIMQMEKDLQQSKQSLAQRLVEQKQAEQQSKILQAEISKYEGYAVKALEQDEALALEVAEQIAILENELGEQQRQAKTANDTCDELRRHIRQTEQNLQRAKQLMDTVKATNNVQQAQQNVANAHGSASGENSNAQRPQTARDVLERIKKQRANSDKNDADNLQSKLMKAGIISDDEEANATAVLERIKGLK